MSDTPHTFLLVGRDELGADMLGDPEELFRWTFQGTLPQIPLMAFDLSLARAGARRRAQPTLWHCECSCGWRCEPTRKASELAGPAVAHLVSVSLK